MQEKIRDNKHDGNEQEGQTLFKFFRKDPNAHFLKFEAPVTSWFFYFFYLYLLPYIHVTNILVFNLCSRNNWIKLTAGWHLREKNWSSQCTGFRLIVWTTILVTNRWNSSHLSWIFSKFLTFTLHTFVLTQMCPSPSLILSRAYFGALKWLQTQINIGEKKITQVFQDLWRGL